MQNCIFWGSLKRKKKEAFLALKVCAKLYILGGKRKKKKEAFLALRVCAKLYLLGKFKKKEKKSFFSTQSLYKTDSIIFTLSEGGSSLKQLKLKQRERERERMHDFIILVFFSYWNKVMGDHFPFCVTGEPWEMVYLQKAFWNVRLLVKNYGHPGFTLSGCKDIKTWLANNW